MRSTSPSAPAELNPVLSTSQHGLLMFQAWRDAEGRLTDLRLTMGNAVAEHLLGRSAASVLGQPLAQCWPQIAHTELPACAQRVANTGQSERCTVQYGRPDEHTPVWLDCSVMRLETDSILLLCEDITHIQADALAARHAHLWQQVFDASAQGITLFEAILTGTPPTVTDFRLVMINDTGLRLTNQPRHAVLGRTLRQIYPATEEFGLFHQYVQVFETGEPFEGEHYYADRQQWWAMRVVRLDEGLMVTYHEVTAQRQAEANARQQLQAQAKLLQVISDNTAAGQVLWEAERDASGAIVNFRYKMANRTNSYVTGVAAEGLVGQRLLERFPRFRGTELETALRDALDTGRTQRMIFTYYTDPPGWYDAQFIRVEDAAGPDLVLMTFMDVTEQHQSQLAQKEQADTFAAILKSLHHGLVVFTAIRDDAGVLVDLRYDYASDQIARDTGVAASELIGDTLLQRFPGARQSGYWQAYEMALATGQSQQFEEHYQSDGFDTYLRCQVAAIDRDRVVGTYQIIDDLKFAQQRAETQAQLLQSVIDHIMAGVVLYAPVWETASDGQPPHLVDFEYRLVNAINERTTGRTAEELLQGRHNELFPSADGRAFFEQLANVLHTGQPREELLSYFNDGIEGWFQISMVPHDGQVLFTFSDVTELKRQQQALEVANQELRRSNDNLLQFAYVASHDLQEPLRKIQSYGSMLASQYADRLDAPALGMLDRMQHAAGRMSHLIRDLLDYSRVSTHRAPFTTVALDKLLSELTDDLQVAVREAGATVEIGALPVVQGDKRQLRQLFQNLLSNALKFRQPNVVPHVRVQAQTVPTAELPTPVRDELSAGSADGPAALAGRYYVISVEDNGIGFDEKYLDRIFQVFQRLRSDYAGTGVGLAICRKVAENHRGMLTARSQPGQGATFVVYLPAAK